MIFRSDLIENLINENKRLREVAAAWKDTANAADDVIRATLEAMGRGPETDPILLARRLKRDHDDLDDKVARVEQLIAEWETSGELSEALEVRRALNGQEGRARGGV